MCGITGYFNDENAVQHVRAALSALAARGRDGAGIWTEETGVKTGRTVPAALDALPRSARDALGHALHAMVGCEAQPLRDALGILVANCELYEWKRVADERGIVARNDAHLLLQLLDALPDLNGHAVEALLSELHGSYAFCYVRGNDVVLARDLLGIKPLWYAHNDSLAFASEEHALQSAHATHARELSPRTILFYDRALRTVHEHRRAFFTPPTAVITDAAAERQAVVHELVRAIKHAVLTRVPANGKPYALFLGGGVESALLAHVLGALAPELRPRCYTVAQKGARDAERAHRIAQSAGLSLSIVPVTPAHVTEALAHVRACSHDENPVQLSAGIVTHLASVAAAEDGCMCALSGVGVDEAFATLERHQRSTNRVNEAIASLRKLHERTLTRDDCIAMHNAVEVRAPFLDERVIRLALRAVALEQIAPGAFEANGDKQALREAARALGVPAALCALPRKAPQYGSGVMRVLASMRTNARKPTVAAFTADDTSDAGAQKHARVAVLLSGGKDSVLAAHILAGMHYTLACAITIHSDNPDSYLYHTPNTDIVALQARAMRIPLLTARTLGEPELELAALRETLLTAKREYAITGVCTGAIGSHYQRERIERVCDDLGLTTYSPLWQMNQVHEIERLVREGYSVIFTKVAAEGLDASWLGQPLTRERIEKLKFLHEQIGLHPAGEGGEYESLVLDAPLFHERIQIKASEVIKDGVAATLTITDAVLVPKTSFFANAEPGADV
jgi:asparagine synthase (glutamine-hydrolysing)